MTGDGIRRVALQDAIEACEGELIECKDAWEEDLNGGYNNAIGNCIEIGLCFLRVAGHMAIL